MNKANKLPINPKIMVLEEYYDFLDIFSKKTLNTVTKHSKYNHRIRLLERYKNFGHSPLCRMLQKQLEFVKKFLENNLKKKFIKASSLFYLLPILLAKKPKGDIKFCVDY